RPPLSLHDALPICLLHQSAAHVGADLSARAVFFGDAAGRMNSALRNSALRTARLIRLPRRERPGARAARPPAPGGGNRAPAPVREKTSACPRRPSGSV